MRGLHWFRHDLRLHDNPALAQLAAHCNELVCVFVIDPRWFEPTSYHSVPMAAPRQQFLKESFALLPPTPAPDELPPPPAALQMESCLDCLDEWKPTVQAMRFTGGEEAGLQQLHYYLHETGLVSNYKQTRNDLDGWDFSSKLSPWLAQGCVSPRL